MGRLIALGPGFATLLATLVVVFAGSAGAIPGGIFDDEDDTTPTSGAIDFRDVNFGNFLTECPQAGLRGGTPRPLDRRARDEVEQRSNGGSNDRVNQDYSCLPQDETSLDQNPVNGSNIVGGANDYRLGWGTSGFYASTNNGNDWYDG